MKYTQWITYKGKTFLLVNATRLKEAEYIEALKEYQREWVVKPGHPTIIDVTGATTTTAVTQAGKELNQALTSYCVQHNIPQQPTAIVGISAMARTVANLMSYGQKTHFASDLENAKEWLFKNS